MKNFRQAGDIVDFVAPAGGVVSGQGYLLGSLLVFSLVTAAAGEVVSGVRMGVVEADKLDGDVMAVGDKVNWNDTNKEFQAATSDLDNAATVVEAAGAGAGIKVRVALTPV